MRIYPKTSHYRKRKNRAQVLGGDGCVYYVAKNRHTGTECGAYDADVSGLDGSGEYRWCAVCWTHSSIILTETRKGAIELASRPWNFCSYCDILGD